MSSDSSDYDEDGMPPPLEDMTEALEARKRLAARVRAEQERELQAERERQARAKKHAEAHAREQAKKTKQGKAKKEKKKQGMFGGLQGGFLAAAKKKKKKKGKGKKKQQAEEPIPVLSAQAPVVGGFAEELQRVRAEDEQQWKHTVENTPMAGIVKGDEEPGKMNPEEARAWLFKCLSKDPSLAQAFSSPQVAQALQEFGQDARAALAKYSDNEEVMRAFGQLGNVAQDLAAAAPPPQEQPKPVGRREVSPQQMQQWLADPRLRAVLENPRTSEKLSLLQAHPERIEDMLGDRDVVLLIRAGILDAPHKIKKQLGVQ